MSIWKAFSQNVKKGMISLVAVGLVGAGIPLSTPVTSTVHAGQVAYHKLTVYYWSSFAKPYAYFKTNKIKWSELPGRAMKVVKGSCYKIEFVVSNNDAVTISFNNGYDLWDDAGGKNYTISGKYKNVTIANGVLSASLPNLSLTPKLKPIVPTIPLELPDDTTYVVPSTPKVITTNVPVATQKPVITPGPTATPKATATPKPVVVTPEPTEVPVDLPTPKPVATATPKSGGTTTTKPVTAAPSDLYSVNKTFGKKVSAPITIDGTNNGEWTDANMIASGVANDDPRTLGKNWTLHEVPMDMTGLWAAWDDQNLYVAWQYVDVTDVVDPSNAGSAGNEPVRVQKILQSIAIDTTPGEGSGTDMWGKNGKKPFWTGEDLPDYQIYMASNLWQGFLSKAVDGKFVVDDKVKTPNYQKITEAGIEIKVGKGYAGTKLLGAKDVDDLSDGSKVIDFLTAGHDKTHDSFYEMKIPLAALGNPDIEGKGIGLFLHQGEFSALDTMPRDPAVSDSPGVEDWNSSKEWADIDSFTVPFARVGKSK